MSKLRCKFQRNKRVEQLDRSISRQAVYTCSNKTKQKDEGRGVNREDKGQEKSPNPIARCTPPSRHISFSFTSLHSLTHIHTVGLWAGKGAKWIGSARDEKGGNGEHRHGPFLLSMVVTNLLSIYHLSIRASSSTPTLHSGSDSDQQQLLRQLNAIRATVSHLRSSSPPPPPELVLYSRLAPVASACSAHPDLLHRFMSYTPFAACPDDAHSVAEPLILRGCHPLPRRRCFSPTAPAAAGSLLPTDPLAEGREMQILLLPAGVPGVRRGADGGRQGALDLTVPQLLRLASMSRAGPIRLGLDVGGGTGTLAARLKRAANATVVTTTMDLGAPYSEAAAARGVVPLHAPLQQRLPVGDGTMDMVRAGHAVNRWIPEAALEFLWYDADRVLRPGGLLWVDHFWCRKGDLDGVYAAMLRRLSYKTIKWAVADKPGNAKDEAVYLTALLQKPFSSNS